MDRKFNSLSAQVFDISEIMTSYGLTIPDVTEAECQIKKRQTDLTPIISKSLSSGAAIVADYDDNGTIRPFVLVVTFSFSDYGEGKLEAGSTYVVGVGIKRAADTKFIEGFLLDTDGEKDITMRILQNTMT